MYKISKELKETIEKYLANSTLPARDVLALLNELKKLEEIKEEK